MKWLVETINEVGLALHSREQEISDLETLIKDIDLLMMMRLGKKDRDIAELTNGLAAAKTEVDQLTRRVTQVPVVCFNEKSNDMCRIAWFTKTDKKTDTKTQDTKTQGHKDTETQRHRDRKTQGHKDTETHGHIHTGPQRHRDLSLIQI